MNLTDAILLQLRQQGGVGTPAEQEEKTAEQRTLEILQKLSREAKTDSILQSIRFGTDPQSVYRDDGPGFFSKTGDFLGSFSRIARGRGTPQDLARITVTGMGIFEGGVTDTLGGLSEIPGLFFQREIGTDRMAQFFYRTQEGLNTHAEAVAKSAGLTDDEIAYAHGFGEFIGVTAPIMASFGTIKMLAKAPGSLVRWVTAGNFVTDTAAGLIYGGVLSPGDDLGSRFVHMSTEGAMFGAGRLILNGLLFPFQGYRGRRANLSKQRDKLNELLRRINSGEEGVVIQGKDEAVSVMKLMSEEGFIASSPRAQQLMREAADEGILIEAITDANSMDLPGGLVTDLYGTVEEVNALVKRFEDRFPHFKFTTMRRGTTREVMIKADGTAKQVIRGNYNVYFGPETLSINQRVHFKKYGRVPGQIIEKRGARYEYLDVAGGENNIKVRRSDGTGATLEDKGITDTLGMRMKVKPSSSMDELFDKFYADMEGVYQTLSTEGSELLPEYELIRMIRNGEVKLSPDAKRMVDVDGAIIHAEELGMTTEQFNQMTHEQLLQDILAKGYEAGGLMPTPRIVTFDEMVELWARGNGIEVGTPDFLTLRGYFGHKARQRFWEIAKEQPEYEIFTAIREQWLDLVEKGEIPFEALAHQKGFTVLREEGGSVVLRDINSGFRVKFGSQQSAEEGLTKFVRPERNALGGGLFPDDSGGIGAFTGGYFNSDGVFNLGNDLHPLTFVDHLPLGSSTFRNRRDVFIDLEEATGIPFFTEFIDPINKNIAAMRVEQEPWAYKIKDIWKGISRKEKYEVAEFWRSIEGKKMSVSEMRVQARERGLSQKQINALVRSHTMFDAWHKISNIEPARYIEWYYSRLRPRAEEAAGTVPKDLVIPPGFEWWAEKARHGELSLVEMDPEIVMHRYLRGLLFEKHVGANYNKARALVHPDTKPRFGNLPPDMQRSLQASRPDYKFKPEDSVIDKPLEVYMAEWLKVIRGIPIHTKGTVRDGLSRLFGSIGIQVRPETLEEYINVALSNMYGAAMGARLVLLTRNGSQNLWNMYPRVGARWANASLEKALTLSGYDEALEAGAIRATTGGLPMGDALWGNFAEKFPIRATRNKIITVPIAASMRALLRTGHMTSKFGRKLLVPYSSVDDLNRVWAYYWQKMSTAEHLAKFEAEKISWDKFVEDGLTYFHPVVKRDFARIYNKIGREDALRYIGRQAADESNFIYGIGAQPSKMQSPAGRLVGQFGTWPLWAFEQYSRRSMRGTAAQRAKFWLRSAAMVTAFSNLTVQTGINMYNWMAPFSFLSWAGGPAAQWGIEFANIIGGPTQYKASRLKRLAKDMSRLSLPGQVLVQGDLRSALDAENPAQAGLRLMLGRPVDSSEWAIEWTTPDPELMPFPFQKREEQLTFPRIPAPVYR